MLRILYQDEQVVAVDKPAGILSVPGRNDASPTLAQEVKERFSAAIPVHRLDRDTSGVVLFALGREAHRALNAAFAGRRAEKLYLALVRGDVAARRRIDLPLVETRRLGVRPAQRGKKGAQGAITDVEPRERFGKVTLVACRPRTGRTHQIRAHLAAVGHALAIDPQYGEPPPLRIGDLWRGAPDPDTVVLSRTPLHAMSLRVPHPRGRGWLQVEAPVPDDIARCLDLLRAARRTGDLGPEQ